MKKNKKIESDDWRESIQIQFGNGEPKNETIGGFLGVLLDEISKIVEKERKDAYWEGKGDDW
jgi:hypothetical protein